MLRVVRRASGRETFHPSAIFLGRREAVPLTASPQGDAPAGRDRVVAASREEYCRPLEEVEREIRSIQGWAHPDELKKFADEQARPPSDLDERWAVERLVKEKIDYALALKLVREYGAQRCLRQIKLMPYRTGIKNNSRYLVGAIQNDYPEPSLDK